MKLDTEVVFPGTPHKGSIKIIVQPIQSNEAWSKGQGAWSTDTVQFFNLLEFET